MLQGSAEMKKIKQLKDGTVEIKKIFGNTNCNQGKKILSDNN